MKYPNYVNVQKRAGNKQASGFKMARLYWQALAILSTQGEFAKKTPAEVHAAVVAAAQEVDAHPSNKKGKEAP